ncbi:MAG: peptide deformylase, partial [Clostridia bacterium]|nr:peptide deformylase [Clostridia bacterium]
MATRRIVTLPNPILREKCRIVDKFDENLAQLIDDMTETMFKANGVGLAAPQVGILNRVAVVCTDGETVYELVNPVIVSESGKQIGPEGCLSVPGRQGE